MDKTGESPQAGTELELELELELPSDGVCTRTGMAIMRDHAGSRGGAVKLGA